MADVSTKSENLKDKTVKKAEEADKKVEEGFQNLENSAVGGLAPKEIGHISPRNIVFACIFVCGIMTIPLYLNMSTISSTSDHAGKPFYTRMVFNIFFYSLTITGIGGIIFNTVIVMLRYAAMFKISVLISIIKIITSLGCFYFTWPSGLIAGTFQFLWLIGIALGDFVYCLYGHRYFEALSNEDEDSHHGSKKDDHP